VELEHMGATERPSEEAPLHSSGTVHIEIGMDETGTRSTPGPISDPSTFDADVETAFQAYIVADHPSLNNSHELVEAKVYTDPTDKYTRWILLGVSIVLLTIVAIGLGVAVPQRNGGAGATAAPSLAPTAERIPLDPAQVLEPIFSILESSEDDPVYKEMAFRWLTMDDTNGILHDPDTQGWQIIQRFGAAYLYFSTNGTGWFYQLNFLTSASECEWQQQVNYSDLSYDYGWHAVYDPDFDREASLDFGITSCDEGWITEVVLTGMGLTQRLPYKIIVETMPHLRIFDASSDYTDGIIDVNEIPFPTEIAQLTNLEALYLDQRFLGVAFPGITLATLTNLQYLSMVGNEMTGTIPSELGHLTKLRYLNLARNSLIGSLPVELAYWSKLHSILLLLNQFTGTLSESYSEWRNVVVVVLSVNELTGPLPESYGEWTNIADFELDSNSLTGTLPSSYGAWGEDITLFSVGDNKLTGPLPESYSEWRSMEILYLDQNLLSGAFPESYGQWTNTSFFDLSNNSFTGTLPSSYGNWVDPREVFFNHNYLTGTLPSSYENWTNLWKVNFSSNYLTGTLPSSYENWTNIWEVDFSSNNLTGTIPSSYASWMDDEDVEFYASENCLQEVDYGFQYDATSDGQCLKQ
jgi:hypothetical protein